MNWIRLTVPELGRLQFFIDRQLKVPIFTFFGVKGVKFQMKIGPGVSELWRVENRPLPLTWPMAYTTACTTVQAVTNQNHDFMFKYERWKLAAIFDFGGHFDQNCSIDPENKTLEC